MVKEVWTAYESMSKMTSVEAIHKLTDDEVVFLVSYANQSFRDSADKDYIAARAVYRLECSQQFLWLAEQAVEKYLKAILLYNLQSTKDIGHNLGKALRLIKSIPDLPFTLPDKVEDFVGHLQRVGTNRYLIHPTMQPGDALLSLDKTVWYIRKWCYFIRALTFKDKEGKHRCHYATDLKLLRDPRWKKHRHLYRISGGYLEKVIKNRLSGYEQLIWKNFYYGRRAKRRIYFTRELRFENPMHEVIPEAIHILKDYVFFPKAVYEYYIEQAHNC